MGTTALSQSSHILMTPRILLYVRTYNSFNIITSAYTVHLLRNILSASEEKLVSGSVMLSRKFANLESCRGIDVDAKV